MDAHDERRIALPPGPERTSLLEDIRFWLTFGRSRRNKREAAQAKAAAENAPIREAEMRRAIAQPGTPPDVVEKFSRVLARLGKGEA